MILQIRPKCIKSQMYYKSSSNSVTKAGKFFFTVKYIYHKQEKTIWNQILELEVRYWGQILHREFCSQISSIFFTGEWGVAEKIESGLEFNQNRKVSEKIDGNRPHCKHINRPELTINHPESAEIDRKWLEIILKLYRKTYQCRSNSAGNKLELSRIDWKSDKSTGSGWNWNGICGLTVSILNSNF